MAGSTESLEDMVVQAQAGNLEAFGGLVRATQLMAYAVARRVLHNPGMAEDATQEAYLRAFRRLGDLEEPAAFISWLRRIVITVALNMRRARRFTFLRLDDAPDVPVLDEAETSWSQRQRQRLAGAKALADTAVSTTLVSQNGVPFIAERAMWWPGTSATWQEAHNSPGATATDTNWAFAGGEVGGPAATETYILLANTSATDALVQVKLVFEGDAANPAPAPVAAMFPVPAHSRFNVPVLNDFPAAVGKRFGAIVDSVGNPRSSSSSGRCTRTPAASPGRRARTPSPRRVEIASRASSVRSRTLSAASPSA